ncbi:MAG TPA: PAS domain S-box protein, partial [Xanthobacteraceae bacterium]
MNDVAPHLAFLRDPRLAAHATSAAPVWLWRTDATGILWANPAGAAIFDSATPAALPERRFDQHDPAAAQITRLAGSLRLGGAARLERLRGFGAGFGRMLMCACSRITLADHTPAILVVATQPAGPTLSLAERVRRLYEGTQLPVAAFRPDGTLIHATPEGRARLGGTATLAAIGADSIAQSALASGHADGDGANGHLTIERIGADATTVLVATFAPAEIATPAAQPPAAQPPVAQPPTAEPPAPASPAAEPPAAETPAAEPPLPPPIVAEAPTVAAEAPAAPFEVVAPPIAPEGPQSDAPPVEPTPPAPTDQMAGLAAVERPVPPLRIDVPIPERRHPLRFVWQMDANGRFTLGSDEFTEVIGPRIATALGRSWKEITNDLALDPEGQVARAVATRDTWSGITVSWPVDGSADRLKVELSGLPIYDRSRNFLGYRGFGVCRDIDRIATLAVMRRSSSLLAAQVPLDGPVAPPADPAPVGGSTASPEERPALTLVPSSPNVVPFRSSAPAAEPRTPALSPVERSAFHELARQLTARLKGEPEDRAEDLADDEAARTDQDATAAHGAAGQPASNENTVGADATAQTPFEPPAAAPTLVAGSMALPAQAVAAPHAEPSPHDAAAPLLDQIPVGILVYRLDTLLYANRAFLDWTGYDDLDALVDAGGLDSLFVEPGGERLDETGGPGRTLAIATPHGDKRPVEGRLFSIPWQQENALVLMLATSAADERHKAAETALGLARAQTHELKAILDTATDGVIVAERDGRIMSANRSAEALFGYDAAELGTHSLDDLFAPESQRVVRDDLANLGRQGGSNPINGGREIVARVRQGGFIPLFMTMGRIADDSERVCAIFRDITPWKKQERDLVGARLEAEKASAAKSDFLAKISHEIRTPLNSIIGFSEVMIEERFGPIGNERYRDYLKDIRNSGGHVVSLLNDLLDLSKIEAGKLDLTFTSLNLNEVVQDC